MIFEDNEYRVEETVFRQANKDMCTLEIGEDIHLRPSPGHLSGSSIVVPDELNLLYLKKALICHTTRMNAIIASRLSPIIKFEPDYAHINFWFNRDFSIAVIHPHTAGVLHIMITVSPSNLLLQADSIEVSFNTTISPVEGTRNIYFDGNLVYINSPFDDGTDWVPDFTKYTARTMVIIYYNSRTGYSYWFKKDRLLGQKCYENIMRDRLGVIHTASGDWLHLRAHSNIFNLTAGF